MQPSVREFLLSCFEFSVAIWKIFANSGTRPYHSKNFENMTKTEFEFSFAALTLYVIVQTKVLTTERIHGVFLCMYAVKTIGDVG